jgi:voltage-gated potassium channel
MGIFLPRFVWTLALLLALIVIGTSGYLVIEERGVADALYMTVITLTAVGYEEVWHLSRAGRVFTMLLLLGGITWMGFWFASLTSLIVELDLQNVLRRRRTMREITKMRDHVIICGAGRTGRQVVQELEKMESDYVIVEADPKRVEELRELIPNAHILEGDATHDQILIQAGLLEAAGLVTCLSSEADNLFVCLSARDLAVKVKIVARAYEEEAMDKLYRAGADHVVSPNMSGAIRMASVLLRPSVVSFLDIATRSSQFALRMEETIISEGSKLAGRTLGEARIPYVTGLIVIAIRKDRGTKMDFVFNPGVDTQLEAGDHIIVLGSAEQVDKLRGYVG